MPASTTVKTQASTVTPQARSQPWKKFMQITADADKARTEDFITIHANEGDETGEFHDYATQLG